MPLSVSSPEGISTATTGNAGRVDHRDRVGEQSARLRFLFPCRGSHRRSALSGSCAPQQSQDRSADNLRDFSLELEIGAQIMRRIAAKARRACASSATSQGIRFFLSRRATTKPSPPLLPLPATISTPFLAARAKLLRIACVTACAGALHQCQARHAVFLDRQPIHLAHLFGGDDDHNKPCAVLMVRRP